MYIADADVPVTRLQLRPALSGLTLTKVTNKPLFLKGPIPMEWLGAAAKLPGKALNVALAIQWLAGMNAGKPVKLNRKALGVLHVSDDACGDGLRRLEGAGLISVTRPAGQRPTITVTPR